MEKLQIYDFRTWIQIDSRNIFLSSNYSRLIRFYENPFILNSQKNIKKKHDIPPYAHYRLNEKLEL